ncbi:MAG: threonine/serine exporter family protein, partial [Chloroflexaceae bacterium]|nr:threonine/serine exporter family protein [Chloroflexaceae bacterium]
MHLKDPLLDQLITKPPLSHDELRDVTELALWAGQLLLQHGAEAARVEETVHRLGTGLGCDWMDILVSPNVIIVTAVSGEEFRTRVRRVANIGVNLSIVSEVSDVSRGVAEGRLNRAKVRTALRRIGKLPHRYNRWLVAFMVGLACASFSRLFGGDWAVFGVTFGAASVAQVVRQELVRRYFNTLLVVISTAFVAGVIA